MSKKLGMSIKKNWPNKLSHDKIKINSQGEGDHSSETGNSVEYALHTYRQTYHPTTMDNHRGGLRS